MASYILGIDQSTQGTKALLFDDKGKLIARSDLPHRQMIDDKGWVEHDLDEIYANTIKTVRLVVEKAGISPGEIAGVGISNQRETAAVWNDDGTPVCHAIVWQCARGKEICGRLEKDGHASAVQKKTGIRLSPYFTAAKFAWVIENIDGVSEKIQQKTIRFGTIDSYLLYRLTSGKSYYTDYSNASRTQLFHVGELRWDPELCDWFGVPIDLLPKVCDSNSHFGETDFEGYLPAPVPIAGMLGDSHGALFGQGCLNRGMVKATFGTGSSVMMHVGEKPVYSKNGLVTSLAWGMDGKVEYVLEGNLNYTGAVISWLKDDLRIITSASETQELAFAANPADQSYLVPAFTGLGAPYWDSDARAGITGMTRTTRKEELVRAALDCIAYQIADVVQAMSEDAGTAIRELRVDGGPTKNAYLMQFQSDILDIAVQVPDEEELSGIGAAYAAGLSLGIYDKEILFSRIKRNKYMPQMGEEERGKRISGWKKAVQSVITEK